MSLFNVGDMFGVTAANSIRKLWYGESSTGQDGECRLVLESGVYKLKRYNGTAWEIIASTHAADITQGTLPVSVIPSDLLRKSFAL